jgi:NAD(P)-dependent dehydrogenase (short-subunit alcohol dehydrogenase family)
MKSVLITGAAGNLGQATVSRLLRDGYRVYAALGPGESAEAFGENAGQDALRTQAVDLTDEAAAERYVETILKDDPDLEAAVLLVGGWGPGKLAETRSAGLDKMFRLNFFTAFHVVRPLLEHFRKRGGGQFVLIGARAALKPGEGKNSAAYALSKGLLFQLAELINSEGREANVRATILAPSTLDTPQNRKSMPDADPSKWVPLQDAADTIAFVLDGSGKILRETVLKIYNQA